ncbi:hypothetical protein UlMin_020093 [Ulmus minor]
MYSSLAAAKAAVISLGKEISTLGLPARICPLVFVFTGSQNDISLSVHKRYLSFFLSILWSQVKTWLKTKIQQQYLTKYVLHFFVSNRVMAIPYLSIYN